MAENLGRETPPNYNEENKTAGQPLADFLLQLEDYTPTVCIFVVLQNSLDKCFEIVFTCALCFLNYGQYCCHCSTTLYSFHTRYQMPSASITCIQLVSTLQIPECKNVQDIVFVN